MPKPQPQPEVSITSNIPSPPRTVTTPSQETPSKETPPKEIAPEETQPQETASQGEEKLFRVIIGPVGEEEAKKLKENLDKEGKQAILVPTDGKYKLQLGAFSQKENAQQLVDELKQSGYNPAIEQR